MTLDLQHVEGQEDDLSDTDDGSGERGHHRLSGLGAEGALEVGAVVLGEVVAHEGLSAVLVDSLEDLVACGVAESGEEGEELLAYGGSRFVFEDDLVELCDGGDLAVR